MNTRGTLLCLIFFVLCSPTKPCLAHDYTPPITGVWNGFNEHLNVVECSNVSAYGIDLKLSLYDNSSVLIGSVPFSLAAGRTDHIILNAFPLSMQYGTYVIERVSGAESSVTAIVCATMIYRMANASAGKSVEYAFSIPALDPLSGNSAGVYNSMNPSAAAQPVANWLSLYNPGTQPFSARIEVFPQNGGLSPSRTFELSHLPPKQRRDFSLGHDEGQVVGLYRILPENQSQQYGAFLTRYARKDGASFSFAFPLFALPGTCDPGPIHVSTMDPATNWIEIANPSPVPVSAALEMLEPDGVALYEDTLTISPFSQVHIHANQYLGERGVGVLRAQCAGGPAAGQGFLLQSVFYGHPEQGSAAVEWAYASQAWGTTAVAGEHLVNTVNTYLEAANWNKLLNAQSQGAELTGIMLAQDSSGVTTDLRSLWLSASIDTPLHEYSGFDFTGFSRFSTQTSGSEFSSELLRVFPRAQSKIGYIMNVHSALIPANIVLAEPSWSAAWHPEPGTSWQWDLDAPIDSSVDADVYDIDLFDNDASVVATLHAQGRKVVCYMSAGTWEEWRPDAADFPAEVLGQEWPEWPGERYLDIRRIDLLAPIMRARLDLCRSRGFDAVEPDNLENYDSDTGFPITYAEQIAYNTWLANEAHARGLAIALKNDSAQVADLLPYFDFAVTEDCFFYSWCEDMLPFVQAGKAVFDAEYTDTGIQLGQFCPQANSWNVDAILKNRNLDAARWSCR